MLWGEPPLPPPGHPQGMPLQWNEHVLQDDPSSIVGASLVGALGGGRGVSPIGAGFSRGKPSTHPFSCRLRRQKGRKGVLGDTPKPARETSPPGPPILIGSLPTALFIMPSDQRRVHRASQSQSASSSPQRGIRSRGRGPAQMLQYHLASAQLARGCHASQLRWS